MRADIEFTSADQALLDRTPAPPRARRRERRIDGFDSTVLGVFAAISMWVMAVDGWQVVVNGRVWTGTDGIYIVDQMQYLAWIRDAANHVLASNLFVLRTTPHDYFQPAVLISGGITALGVAPWITLLLWKPVAVIVGFWAARTYVNRSLDGLWQRRAGLVLCLFFGCFTVIFGQFGVLGDLFPGFLSWGYTFGLIALAAMVGGLLTYDSGAARAAGRVDAGSARSDREPAAPVAGRGADPARDRQRVDRRPAPADHALAAWARGRHDRADRARRCSTT